MAFSFTSTEENTWRSLVPMLVTAAGDLNPELGQAYIEAARLGLPSYNRNYQGRLKELVVFLKKNPDYIAAVLPALYKVAYDQDVVRDFLGQMDSSVLVPQLQSMFATEKDLGTQIALLMDIGRYGEHNDVKSLDLGRLLKAKPDRLLKALTPEPSTWDDFMVLAIKLRDNPQTVELAHQIAMSVGLQVALDKTIPRPYGINQYNWLAVAQRWEKHGWEWSVLDVLARAKGRVKGMTLESDMLVSFGLKEHPHPEKSIELLSFLSRYEDSSIGITAAAIRLYLRSPRDIQLASLEYFNAMGSKSLLLSNGGAAVSPQDLGIATNKLVATILKPQGWTQAQLLGHDRLTEEPLPCVGASTMAVARAMFFSDLDIGDMNAACHKILTRWMNDFRMPLLSHDHRPHAIEEALSTLGSPMPEGTRNAIRASTGFKQLLLYSAYMYATNPEWTRYSIDFMPDIGKKPLGMLPLMYPEHNTMWADLQKQVLLGKTDFKDAFRILAKVFFDKDLTLEHLDYLREAVGSTVEDVIASMVAPHEELVLTNVDFGSLAPSL